MFWNYLRNKSSSTLMNIDTMAMVSVVSGTAYVLYQAHLEGRQPLVHQVRASHCKLLNDNNNNNLTTLSSQQCSLLSERGYLIIDNFLSKQEIANANIAARIIVDEQQSNGRQFRASGNQQEEEELGRDRVRTDRVCFLSGSNDNDGLDHVRRRLRGIASVIEESDFQGFVTKSTTLESSTSTSGWIGVPDGMQLSLYERRNEDTGAYYSAHLDGCSDSFLDLGLLGYLRSNYLRKRYITVIVYINSNDDWDSNRDGGCLRIHNDSNWTDVAPVGGRLVLFSSQNQLHEVLPTLRERMACSLWLTLNDDDAAL